MKIDGRRERQTRTLISEAMEVVAAAAAVAAEDLGTAETPRRVDLVDCKGCTLLHVVIVRMGVKGQPQTSM